jgi:hypothetical protein
MQGDYTMNVSDTMQMLLSSEHDHNDRILQGRRQAETPHATRPLHACAAEPRRERPENLQSVGEAGCIASA